MMVIFLVGLVSMILMRTLRKDYARYSKDEEMDDMVIHINIPFHIFFFTDSFLFFVLSLVIVKRNVIWVMNTVGNKCMAMYSVLRRILYSFQL